MIEPELPEPPHRGPKMRAGYMQASLKGLRRLGDENAERVRQLIGPERLGAIGGARFTDWLPVEFDACMSQSVASVAGLDELRSWSAHAFTQILDGPMLGALAKATVRLFGLCPGRLMSAAPKAWAQIYRDAGTVHVEAFDEDVSPAGHMAIRIRFEGLPPVIRDSQAYVVGLEGPFWAALSLCQKQGEIQSPRPGAPEFVYVARWRR